MKKKETRAYLLFVLVPLRDLLDSEKCAEWLAAELHSGGPPSCPQCGHIPPSNTMKALQSGRRVRCRRCGKGFNIWSGTLLEAAKIEPAEFVLMRVALAAGLDFTGLLQLTGRHGQCVSAWVQKIREFEAQQLENSALPGDGDSSDK